MKTVLKRANAVVASVEETFAIALFYALLVGITVQVVARFVLRIPIPWSEEFCRYVFVWLSAIGASVGVRWGTHFVAFDLPGTLDGWSKAAIEALVRFAVGLVAFVMLVEGVHLARQGASQLTPILDVPMSWAMAAIPVSGALMLWHLAAGWILGRQASGLENLLGLEDRDG